MNATDLPASHEDDLEEPKQQLISFCQENNISKFDVEDILELLQDGEPVEWLIDQLKSDAPDLDDAVTHELLTKIQTIVGPEDTPEDKPSADEEPSVDEEALEDFPAETAAAADTELPDASGLDLSQIDMSQIQGMLPKGMQLPPGMGMKQLQQIMESPKAKIMTDLLTFCKERGVDINSLDDPQQMQELEEEWKKTPRPALDGKTPAELLDDDPTLGPSKVETYHRQEPRIGRNDPCPCGSGKKYKKCCGRAK